MNQKKFVQGYTLLELLIVIGIIGMLMVAGLPSILNTLETRSLESDIRDIQTAFEQAKLLAIKDKVFVRVCFDNAHGYWECWMQRQNPDSTWSDVTRFQARMVSPRFTTTVNLPLGAIANRHVEFSSLGMVSNYDTNQNSITIQSPTLLSKSQDSRRRLTVYAGGSFDYEKLP